MKSLSQGRSVVVFSQESMPVKRLARFLYSGVQDPVGSAKHGQEHFQLSKARSRFLRSGIFAAFMLTLAASRADAQTWTLLPPMNPTDVLNMKTTSCTQGATVTFPNASSHNVDFYWIDYNGIPELSKELSPGQSVDGTACVSSPYVAYDVVTQQYTVGFVVKSTAASMGVIPGPNLVNPFVFGAADLSNIDPNTLLSGVLDFTDSTATGISADGTSAALVIYPTGSPNSVTFTTTNGTTLVGYTNDFLTTAPTTTSKTTLPVTPLLIGGIYYALALVQAPGATGESFSLSQPVTVTATQDNLSNQIATLTLYNPPAVFVHGLWSDEADIAPLEEAIERNTSWGKHISDALLVGYDGANAFDGTGSNDGPAQIAFTISQALSDMDGDQIVAGRVDVVAHSMGGLVARSYSGQEAYRSLRDRGLGRYHQIVTIDTPEAGSGLAGYLELPWIRNGTLKSKNFIARAVWDKLCHHADHLWECLKRNGKPLGTGVESLEPISANLAKAPPAAIEDALWSAVSAEVVHPPAPPVDESAEEFGIQGLIDALYKYKEFAPKISELLDSNGHDDAIVSVSSQVAGGPGRSVKLPGLAHSPALYAGNLAQLLHLNYNNVLQGPAVAAQVGCWLDLTCKQPASSAMPNSEELSAVKSATEDAAFLTSEVAGNSYETYHPHVTLPSALELAQPTDISIDGMPVDGKQVEVIQSNWAEKVTDQYEASKITNSVRGMRIIFVPKLLGTVTLTITGTLSNGADFSKFVTINVGASEEAPSAILASHFFLNGHKHRLIARVKDLPFALHPLAIFKSYPKPISIKGFVDLKMLSNADNPAVAVEKQKGVPGNVVLRAIHPGTAMVEARFGSNVDDFEVVVPNY